LAESGLVSESAHPFTHSLLHALDRESDLGLPTVTSSLKSLPRRSRETYGGALESFGYETAPDEAADSPQELEDAGTDGAMACLQANATAAEKIGHGGNRFAVVPAVGADREDQIAEGHVFMVLFHGWKRG
jgi:hypothetical protein